MTSRRHHAKAASSAGDTKTARAAFEAIGKVESKLAAKQSVAPAEWKAAQDAALALAKEVDGFRQTLNASKGELAGATKDFEESGVRTRLMSNRWSSGTANRGLSIAQAALANATAPLSSASDALAAERNAQVDRKIASDQQAKEKEKVPAPKPSSDPSTSATPATVTVGSNATTKETRKAEQDAKRQANEDEKSQDNTLNAEAAAKVAQLQAAGKPMEAELALVEGRIADKKRDAKTGDERYALDMQLMAQQAAVRKKFADQAAKATAAKEAKDAAALKATTAKAATELREQATAARHAADEVADYQLEAQLTILKAYGKEFEATMAKAEHDYAERVRDAKTEEEKLTAKIALEQTKREAIKQRREDIAKRTGVTLPVTATANATQRLKTAKTPQERALAQLDLREAKGGHLSAADEARRDRLRKQTGTGADGLPADESPSSEAAARARLKAAKTPAEKALAQLELREARGGTLSAADVARRDRLREQLGVDPADRVSPTDAASAAAAAASSAEQRPQNRAGSNEARAKVAAIDNPAGTAPPATASRSTPPTSVTASLAFDKEAWAKIAVEAFTPVVRQQVAALGASLRAQNHAAQAQGGL